MVLREKVVSPGPKPWDIDCSGDTPITKQEFRDDCDVNKIIARCVKSGAPLPGSFAPVFADVTGIGDYRAVVERQRNAELAFMALSADVRSYFDNDPVALIEFLQDPSNRDKAVELGILEKPKPPVVEPPVAASAAPPAPAGGAASAAPAPAQ